MESYSSASEWKLIDIKKSHNLHLRFNQHELDVHKYEKTQADDHGRVSWI